MFRCLGSFFLYIYKGAFHIDADQVRAALILVGGGDVHNLAEDLLREGHCGRADRKHALAGLKIGDGLQAGFICIAEVMADSAVEVDIHQAGQRIQAGCIHDLFAGFRPAWRRNAAVADRQVPHRKAVLRRIDRSVFDNHRVRPLTARSWLPHRRRG